MNLDLPAKDLVGMAVHHMNLAHKLNMNAGIALLHAQSICSCEDFKSYLADASLPKQRASEQMAVTRAVLLANPEQRSKLIQQPRTVLIGLGQMDEELRQEWLETGELDERLTLTEYKNLVANLKAKLADSQIAHELTEREKAALAKQLKRRAEASDSELVPLAVADMRSEIAALVKKGQLAADSLTTLGREVADLGATAPDWMLPTARLAFAGLLAVREQLDGSLSAYADLLGERRSELAKAAPAMSFLTPVEIEQVASDWRQLAATHQHEAALREHERKKLHPKGKGRPAAEPIAPGAAKAKGSKK